VGRKSIFKNFYLKIKDKDDEITEKKEIPLEDKQSKEETTSINIDGPPKEDYSSARFHEKKESSSRVKINKANIIFIREPLKSKTSSKLMSTEMHLMALALSSMRTKSSRTDQPVSLIT
jgi:hypothetical protein